MVLFSIQLNSQSWQLIWEDNFDGNSIDATKWTHDYGNGSQFGMWGWGNGELQYYQAQNTTINNGIATIEVKEEFGLVDSGTILLITFLKLLQGVYLILDMVN